mmetsp:Transcript_9125/g.32110  ORF Transcript_9125/g.32110 Transcript_9125/m.32110 type:complete len:111 (-) Transcript_9125:30-362(-)
MPLQFKKDLYQATALQLHPRGAHGLMESQAMCDMSDATFQRVWLNDPTNATLKRNAMWRRPCTFACYQASNPTVSCASAGSCRRAAHQGNGRCICDLEKAPLPSDVVLYN